MPPPEPAPPSPAEDDGVYRMGGRISAAVIGAYLFMLVLIVLLIAPRETGGYTWVTYFVGGLTVFLLARYLSTRYSMDDTHLRAWKLLGGRKVPLEEVRAIEFASLRELAPTGGMFGMGSWGWRGRLFSSTIGEFDSVYTDAARGLLVTAGAYPLYISPRDLDGFARELSRRVRSYSGLLSKDVGNPEVTGESPEPPSRREG